MIKKRVVPIAGVIILLAASFYFINKYLISKPVKPGEYVTSVADYGPVITSVPATGIVNPENEVLLLSPASSLVSSIVQGPGSRVSKGSVILNLNPKSLLEDIDKLKDQIAVMENDLLKNRLNSRSVKVDIDYSAEVKKLKITSLKTEIQDQEQLLKVGGISPALYEQTKEELVLAEKDLAMTLEKNSIRLKQLEADEKGLQLTINIRKKELESKEALLNRMTVRAPSDGIILGIFANQGERVETDKLLVKMSDLSSFKVKAVADNSYRDNIVIGGEVYAIVENTILKGKIGSVAPVMKDKKIEFDVFLDNQTKQKLIPNMEIDLRLVIHKKDSVLRVENGPVFRKSRQQQDLFIIRTGKAFPVKVTTGLVGNEYVEILSGLSPGDRVIISDISPARQKKEIAIEDL
jgi:HlyD family secretion protein